MKKVVEYLYYALILCFALPSGVFMGVPLKLLLTVACLVFFVLWIIYEKKEIIIDKVIIAFLFILFFILLWSYIGILGGYINTVLMCLKSIISLLLIVAISYLLYKHNIVNYKKICRLVFFVAITTVIIKIICEVTILSGFVDWNEFRSLFGDVFGSELTTMEVEFGGFTFYRLMSSNDAIPLIVFGFYIIFEEKNVFKKLIITLVLFAYTLIIYSRMFFLHLGIIFGVCVLCVIYDYLNKTTSSRIINFGIICMTVIVFLALVIKSNPDMLEDIVITIEERFSGTTTEKSDSFRDEQYNKLYQGFLEKPLLGHGLGSYVVGYQRSKSTPYSYEAEYLSFLFQFGIVGFVLIIVSIIVLFFYICLTGSARKKLKFIVCANLLVWAIKPFFNPQFLSSNSGMVIVTLFVLSNYYSSIQPKRLLGD